MAERRMISKKVIYKNSFLDLNEGAIALYMFLIIEADDDGFVDGLRRIPRCPFATEENLSLLINSGYVIKFRSGVLLIAHWKKQNVVARDRYTPTEYKAEKAQVYIDDDGSYRQV